MDKDILFALIHSPLVGPLTWSLIAADLRGRGMVAVVPALHEHAGDATPYWRQHADAAAEALAATPADRPVALVGHSGAGPLLPAIARAARRPIAAYIFVDAGLPHDGASRLDALEAEDPDFARELRGSLAAGRRFPEWTEGDLREIIPDERLRRGMLSELRPRPLAFFAEPIPGFSGRPDAPCAYVQFSAAYAQPAAQARQDGWAYWRSDAGHFHMLVDPAGVADVLSDLARPTWT